MKPYSWIPWLLAIFFVCLPSSDGRYRVRRPLSPSPPPMFKKPWPISHRVSMGNTIHINTNFPHKRPIYVKTNNLRLRRPQLVFNGPPQNWKNPIPMISAIPNVAVLPHRTNVKEFNVINKASEYSPEYKPEPLAFPPTHQSSIDDERGPIHTIPAPNLSIADKPYNSGDNNFGDNNVDDYRRFPVDTDYNSNNQATNDPQRPATNPPPTQTPYEVTETNDIGINHQTSIPTFYTPEYELPRVPSPSAPSTDLQSNEVYLNHPPVSRSGVVGTNIQFGQSNMQTNLHSSLHVGFPGTAAQAPTLNSQISDLHVGQQPEIHIGQQIPELHVGHPAIAGPPMSATQLYELFNSFPQPFDGRSVYSPGHQPQLQQHILQQQLGLFQPEASATTFSQPQMHSFNYDEQANKQQQQQQQQILLGQDYASGRVTADYNIQPEQSDLDNSDIKQSDDGFGYQPESVEQPENNIEYEEAAAAAAASNQQDQELNQNAYLNTETEGGSALGSHYTTLPRDTAEKLAALAAAGNVNSHLIQLRKQREREQQLQAQAQETGGYDEVNEQNDEPTPNNHRGNYQVNEQVDDVPNQAQETHRQRQRLRISAQKRYRQHHRQQQIQQEQAKADKHYEREGLNQQLQQEDEENADEKKPLRIMVPDVEESSKNSHSQQSSDNSSSDYEYDNSESEHSSETRLTDANDDSYDNISTDFGSKIRNKSRK